MRRRRSALLALAIAAVACIGAAYCWHTAQQRGVDLSGTTSIAGPFVGPGSINFANAPFRFLYVIGFGITGYKINPDGSIVNMRVANSGDIGCRVDAITTDKPGQTLYLGCTPVWMAKEGRSSVLPCRIRDDGWIKPIAAFRVPTGQDPISMTRSANGKYLYVSTKHGIYQYALSADGKARPLTPPYVPGGIAAAQLTISTDGKYAYAANYSENRVYQMRVDSGGRLTPLSPEYAATGAGPMEARCDPNGRYVWCVSSRTGVVNRFAVAGNGTLARLADATNILGREPTSMVITPDSKYAYVARYRYNSIYQFTIRADGTFTRNTPISAPGAGSPATVRLDDSGKYAFALNVQHGMLSLFHIGSAGNLDPMDPSVLLAPSNCRELALVARPKH